MRGAITMAFGLIVLQVALSTPLAGLLGAAAAPARWARQWMDPTVALIPAPAAAHSQHGGGSTVNMNLPPGTGGPKR